MYQLEAKNSFIPALEHMRPLENAPGITYGDEMVKEQSKDNGQSYKQQ